MLVFRPASLVRFRQVDTCRPKSLSSGCDSDPRSKVKLPSRMLAPCLQARCMHDLIAGSSGILMAQKIWIWVSYPEWPAHLKVDFQFPFSGFLSFSGSSSSFSRNDYEKLVNFHKSRFAAFVRSAVSSKARGCLHGKFEVQQWSLYILQRGM